MRYRSSFASTATPGLTDPTSSRNTNTLPAAPLNSSAPPDSNTHRLPAGSTATPSSSAKETGWLPEHDNGSFSSQRPVNWLRYLPSGANLSTTLLPASATYTSP